MKKILLGILVFFLVFGFTGCGENKNMDAVKFKEEYEKLNGTTNSTGQEHRTISVSEDNPFVYTTPEEVVKKMDNNETFYVYFGSSYCPWCRSIIEKAIEVANNKGIETIYYVDVWGGEDHKEVFRDVYELDEEGKPKVVSEGTEAYYTLIERYASLLSDYTLTDGDSNKVPVGEKRIGAPNFIYVENGEAIRLTTGISSSQKGSRDELTEENLSDEEAKFTEFFAN